MKATIDVDETNFETEVLKSAQPVLVDFWSAECSPCKMLAPVLEEIATEQAGRVKIAKVDVPQNLELALRYGIRAMPTLLYFLNGEVRNQTLGLVSKKRILAELAELTAAA